MSRLIDAEQIKLTSESFCDADGDVLVPLSEVRKAIALTPTVDTPVIHAYWIPKPCFVRDITAKNWCCSNCSKENNRTKYCPDCGAKMDGDN